MRHFFLAPFLGLLCAACGELDPQFGALRTEDGDSAGPADAGAVSFTRDIRPLMDRAADDAAGPGCRKCHYSTEAEHVGLDLGGLDLATLGELRQGGATSGSRIVVAGDPVGSVLVQKLRGTYPQGERMPRSGPPYLSDEETLLIERWIDEGARGADGE